MTATNKVHQANLSFWAVKIKEQAESGMTIKDWCSANNLSIHKYSYWKSLLKQEFVDNALPDIVSLSELTQNPYQQSRELYNSHTFSDSCTSSQMQNSYKSPDLYNNPSCIQISIGDLSLTAKDTVSDERLLALIKAVRHA